MFLLAENTNTNIVKHSHSLVRTKVWILTFQYLLSKRRDRRAGSAVGSPGCVGGIDWVSLLLGLGIQRSYRVQGLFHVQVKAQLGLFPEKLLSS